MTRCRGGDECFRLEPPSRNRVKRHRSGEYKELFVGGPPTNKEDLRRIQNYSSEDLRRIQNYSSEDLQ